MTHPLIPQILDIAAPVAESLGLDLVGAIFHTHQNPPVLRVDIRNLQHDTSLDDCEQMSRTLEPILDAADIIPGTYVLEVSSPGISRTLTTEREFISFKGFPVTIRTSEPFIPGGTTGETGKQEWNGNLVGQDETNILLNQKGRTIAIPRSLVTQVQLSEKRG